MNTSHSKQLLASALFAILVLPALLAAQAEKKEHQHYKLTDLGTLGGSFSEGVGINNRGSVSGNSRLRGDMVVHGFFWREGVMTDLGTLGGPNSFAPEEWAPNERDEVAGFSDTAMLDPNAENFCGPFSFLPADPYICRAFVWRHGVLTALPTLGGNNGGAIAINNRGQVVGVSETNVADPSCAPFQLSDIKAVRWESNEREIQELPPLPGDTEAVANGINDNGQVVGASGNCLVGAIEAVLWQDDRPMNLGTLGGAVFNIAFGINNRGQVVGQSNLPGDTTHHAFLWTKHDGMQDLGTILGLPNSLATSINIHGHVVGFSQDANGDFLSTVAWIWQDGMMTDLNTLIPTDSPWFLVEALGINDRGQITGIMFNGSTGEAPGFVLTPVQDSEDRAPVAQSSPGRSSAVVLPENVRQALRQRLGSLYHFPVPGAPKN